MWHSSRSILLTISFFLSTTGFGQVLIKERVWTSSTGKKLRAELLAFDRNSDLIKLRVKEGNIYKIKPESLSREDQAQILKARLDSQFRSHFSEKQNAHFFYSEHIPKAKENDSIVAYIGNDRDGGWLRLKGSFDPELLEDGEALIFDGISSGLVKIEYGVDDIETRRSRSTLDISVTRHARTLNDIFSDPKGMKVIFKMSTKDYLEVGVSRAEREGLKETVQAFSTLRNLATDHVWWSTFRGMSPEDTVELQKEMDLAKNPPKPPEKPARTLIKSREWTHESKNTTFTAAVTGFNRHRVNLRREDGTTESIPIEELSRENRDAIALCRMDTMLFRKWHPYDDQHVWHWPVTWPEGDERFDHPLIVFAIDHESGRPRLFLQQRYENQSGLSITSCRLSSSRVYLDLDLPAGNALKMRSPDSTLVWIPFNREESELLMVAAPAMDGLVYEIFPESGDPVQGQFTEEEFSASIEAIETYRIWNSLEE